jgi:hypothetical protein
VVVQVEQERTVQERTVQEKIASDLTLRKII